MRIKSTFNRVLWVLFFVACSVRQANADGIYNEPNFKAYLGMPTDVYSNYACPPTTAGGDPAEYKLINKVASAVFVGTVKKVTSNYDGPIFHVRVKSSWKGVSPGKEIELRSSKLDKTWPDAPQVGHTYLVMAAGKPLVWRVCTYSLDVTDLDKKSLTEKEKLWSTWFGLKKLGK